MGISGVDYQDGPEDVHKSAKISGQEVVSWRERFQVCLVLVSYWIYANIMTTDSMAALKNPKNIAAIVSPASALPIPGSNYTNKPANLKLNKLQIPIVASVRPRSLLPSSTQTNLHSIATGLFAVSIRQALFIAPCSFHFKRITPLIESHHLAFSCPLCRTYADLDEDDDVQPTDLDAYAEVAIDEGPSKFSNKGASIHSSIQYSWQRSVLSGLIPRTMQPTKRNPETCTLPKHPHQVYQKLVVRVPKPLGGAGPRSRRKPADMRISAL